MCAVPVGDDHGGHAVAHDHLDRISEDRRAPEELRVVDVRDVEDHQAAVAVQVVEAIALDAGRGRSPRPCAAPPDALPALVGAPFDAPGSSGARPPPVPVPRATRTTARCSRSSDPAAATRIRSDPANAIGAADAVARARAASHRARRRRNQHGQRRAILSDERDETVRSFDFIWLTWVLIGPEWSSRP